MKANFCLFSGQMARLSEECTALNRAAVILMMGTKTVAFFN